MKNRQIFWLVSVGVLLVVLSVFVGCEKKIVNEDTNAVVSVAVDGKAMVPGAISAIDRYELLVEGSDFGSIIDTMHFENGMIYATVTVPAGKDRRFSVRAYQKGTILYQGDRIIDVIAQAPITLDIVLSPVVPLMNITPHYQNHLMNDSVFYVDVNVFNMPNLAGISFDFVRNYSPTNLDTIQKGEQYSDSVSVSYYYSDIGINITVQNRNSTNPIVDAQGNAHLVNIGLVYNFDWGYDTATVVMGISPSWWYSTANPVPQDTALPPTDNAVIVLTAPLLTGSHDASADDRAIK